MENLLPIIQSRIDSNNEIIDKLLNSTIEPTLMKALVSSLSKSNETLFNKLIDYKNSKTS